MENKHRFSWKWNLSDLDKVPQNGKTVFSCFSCGGGSSMGYKLAGYKVIGNLEIDPRVNKLYKENLHPEISYEMDIRDFNKSNTFPPELKCLDILDGSPPCSTFSTAGEREEGWNKEKKFREGQKLQKLDDLFFHFIETTQKLQPKVVVAENVSGLLKGNAKGYVNEIIHEFQLAGYKIQIFDLNAATMGVPQMRERVFFIGQREDMNFPKLKMNFNEPVIPFGAVRSKNGRPIAKDSPVWKYLKYYKKGDVSIGQIARRNFNKVYGFGTGIASDERPCPTLTTKSSRAIRIYDKSYLSDDDTIHIQTFPEDYNFMGYQKIYTCGMSVPPVMMANVATEIYNQWLKNDS